MSADRGGAEADQGSGADGPRVREAMGGIGRRIEEIISSAERFADNTRAEAEAQGQELVERRSYEAEHAAIEREAAAAQLIDRIDADLRQIVASMHGLREQLLDAARGLESAATSLDHERSRITRPGEERQEGDGDEGETGVRAVATDESLEAAKDANPPVVLASQMALSGMSREEIAQTLRTRFAIADPEPIVDQALAREP